MSDFDTYFAKRAQERKQAEAGRVSTAVALPDPVQPDQFAEQRNIGRNLGIPAGVVAGAPELFQQQDTQRKANQALAQAPRVTSWMADYENQRLARDDLDNLGWWERNAQLFRQGEARATVQGQEFGRDLAATAEVGLLGRTLSGLQERADEALLTNQDGTPNLVGRVANWARGIAETGDAVPRQRVGGAEVSQEERQAAILGRPLNAIGQAAQADLEALEASGIAPMGINEVEGFTSALRFAAENGVASLPYMLTAIASGGVAPATSFILMGGEANAELKEKLPDMPVEQRTKLASAAGGTMAALELFGLSKVLGPLSPGKVAADAIEGTLVETLVKNGVSQAAARTIQAGIAEGTTEVLQEGIVMAVTAASGGTYAEGEVRERLITAFAAGGAVGGGMRGSVETTQGTANLLRDAGRWATSGQTQAQLAEIDEMAAGSKLKTRAPDKFQEALDAAGIGDGTIEIPAAELHTFFQAEVSDETISQLGIDRSDYEAALSIGGDVSVPVSNYATHFSGTDAATVFSEHGRIDANEMSVAEARAYEQTVSEQLMDAMQADEKRAMTPPIQAAQQIEQQLLATGRQTPAEAKSGAAVLGGFFESVTERLGDKGKDFATRFGIEVRGMSDIPPGGATDAEVATDPAAVSSPPSPDQVFEQPAARDVQIEVEFEDGTTESVNAGEAKDALDQRRRDANTLLECIRYGA